MVCTLHELGDVSHLIHSIGEELLLHDGAEFERVFHTTHFFVTNFFVISRCKDTNLFLFGKTFFGG